MSRRKNNRKPKIASAVYESIPTPERMQKGFGIRGDRKGMSVRKAIEVYFKRGVLGEKGSDAALDRYEAALHFIRLWVIAEESAVQPAMLDWAKLTVGLGSSTPDPAEAHRRAQRIAKLKREYQRVYDKLATADFGRFGRLVLMRVCIHDAELGKIEQEYNFPEGMAGTMLRVTLDNVRKFSDL